MSNKRIRNKVEMTDLKTRLTVFVKKPRLDHSHRMAYSGTWHRKKPLEPWKPKSVRGSLSGQAKEYGVVGMNS